MKKQRPIKINIPLLAICVAIPLVVAAVGSFVTVAEIPSWYSTLEKPFFSPPNWIFGPVWTTLYVLQGLALYALLMSKSKNLQLAVILFSAQLGMNLAWSIIFFGLHDIIWALIEIGFYLVLLIVTCLEFSRHSKTAGWLLLPSVLWVGFATILNAGFALLN